MGGHNNLGVPSEFGLPLEHLNGQLKMGLEFQGRCRYKVRDFFL